MSHTKPTELIRYLELEFSEECLTGPKLVPIWKRKWHLHSYQICQENIIVTDSKIRSRNVIVYTVLWLQRLDGKES